MEKGRLPNLARLVREGASGVLRSEPPLLSPIVWTTMMTGRSPLDHRILDFTRFHPRTGAREPIGVDERRVPAIWNVFSDNGRTTGVFGLWATYPAEPVNGVLITDRFLSTTASLPGAVHPPERVAWAEKTRAEARSGTTEATLRELVPDLAPGELEIREPPANPWSDPLTGAFHLLARTETTRRLATDWLTNEPWDAALVYFDGTDTIGHLVASRIAAADIGARESAEGARLLLLSELFFARMDRIVGELAQIAETRGATLVVASDHGFDWQPERPKGESSEDVTAAEWHREEGVYLLHGPAIAARPGHPGRGEAAQLAATLLVLAGLSPGTKMAPPFSEAGAVPAAVDLPDLAARTSLERLNEGSAAAAASAEELARLAALGYLSPAEAKGSDREKRQARPYGTRTAGSLSNEAAILERSGDVAGAAKLYAAAVEQEPDSAAAKWNLSSFLFEQGREAARSDELLLDAFALGMASAERRLVDRARRLHRDDGAERADHLLDRAVERRPEATGPRLLRGQIRVTAGRCREAEADFEQVVRGDPSVAAGWGALGMARLCLGDRDSAREALARAVALEPENEGFRRALARIDGDSRR